METNYERTHRILGLLFRARASVDFVEVWAFEFAQDLLTYDDVVEDFPDFEALVFDSGPYGVELVAAHNDIRGR